MALTQLYVAVPGEIITAARWNNEFGNIYNNGTDVAFPLTKAVSFAGFSITWDVAGVSTITSTSSLGFLFTIGGKSGNPGVNGSQASFAATTFTDTSTGASGTAPLYSGVSVRQPTLAASATLVTTTIAASLYVEGAPVAGSNETLSGPYGIYTVGMLGSSVGADIASAATIAITSNFHTVTGTTNISAITQQYASGTVFNLRFTGTGLNIIHHATSMISPWARNYRTVLNEIIQFISLGSGNYIFYSLNGPKERVGVTVEANVSAAMAGYLVEDGVAISRTTYSGLFAEIGTTFGTGDGSTTFNPPDTRGRTIINIDGAANRITSASVGGGNADTLGGAGGAQTHVITNGESDPHTHSHTWFTAVGTGSGNPNLTTNSDTATPVTPAGWITNSTGGGAAHNNTQPWMAKAKFIRF